MIRIPSLILLSAGLSGAFAAGAPSGYPFQDETLHYSVNWPSGLSLGEATTTAHHTASGWDLSMTLVAGIPGFMVTDGFHSVTNADGCSLEFQRTLNHGARKTTEKTAFDYRTLNAHRVTTRGGASDLSISQCAHDALALVFYARRELGQGRVPPAEDAFFGSPHSVRMEYTGAETIQVGEKSEITDRVAVDVRGPSSNTHFDIFFARDPARTPLSVRVPFSVGTLSMDLVR